MFILTKLSLAAFLIVSATIVAEATGILDSRYSKIILYSVLAIQVVLLAISTVIFIIIKKRRMHGVRIVRYQLHDTLVKGNTDILPENISPTNPRKSALFKIFLEIENVSEIPEIGIFKMDIGSVVPDIKDHITSVRSGMIDNSFVFNADVIVKPGEKINFQIKKDTTVKLFFLGEVYTP